MISSKYNFKIFHLFIFSKSSDNRMNPAQQKDKVEQIRKNLTQAGQMDGWLADKQIRELEI